MTDQSFRSGTSSAAWPMILLDPIAEGTWRVLDYRHGKTGIDVLVGFVQSTADGYALTDLSRPDEQRLCHDLLEVQEFFGTETLGRTL